MARSDAAFAFKRGDAFLNFRDTGIKIAGSRAHHYQRSGRIAPMLAGDVLQTIKSRLDGLAKRGNIGLNFHQDLRRNVFDGITHKVNITETLWRASPL